MFYRLEFETELIENHVKKLAKNENIFIGDESIWNLTRTNPRIKHLIEQATTIFYQNYYA